MGGWNFRKRIKIAPGLYINLSKGGLSASVGPRGLNMTIGPRGTTVNTSLPGTGLYRRVKLDSLVGGGSTAPTAVPSTTTSSSTDPADTAEGKRGCGCSALIVAVVVIGFALFTAFSEKGDPALGLAFGVPGVVCLVIAIVKFVQSGLQRSRDSSALEAQLEEAIKRRYQTDADEEQRTLLAAQDVVAQARQAVAANPLLEPFERRCLTMYVPMQMSQLFRERLKGLPTTAELEAEKLAPRNIIEMNQRRRDHCEEELKANPVPAATYIAYTPVPSAAQTAAWNRLLSTFDDLANSTVWLLIRVEAKNVRPAVEHGSVDSSDITRKLLKLVRADCNGVVVGNTLPPCLTVKDVDGAKNCKIFYLVAPRLWLYPAACLTDAPAGLTHTPWRSVSATIQVLRVVERDSVSCPDTEGRVYLYANKDGSPDMRRRDNEQLPLNRYARVTLTGVGTELLAADYNKAKTFVEALNDLKNVN